VIQIDKELIQVTIVNGTTWTLVRGYKGTARAAHADGALVSEYLTHPVLYVGGEGGVYRSTSKGRLWTNYPDLSDYGAPQEGGYLPNAHVTDLDMALGNFNSQTGFFDPSSGYNMLIATTYGRGVFAIRTDNSAVSQFLVVPNSGPKVVAADPILGPNGTSLDGFTVTFDSDIDPTTIDASDVLVRDTNFQLVSVTAVKDVSDLSQAGAPHNKFEIDFASQAVSGGYVLKVGPSVLDRSGNPMNQNGNGVNGEVPTDAYRTVYNFVANTNPSISAIQDRAVQPGQSTGAVGFTVSDPQDAASQLTLSATVVAQGPFTGTLPSFTLTGPSAGGAGSINLTASAGTHGVVRVTVTVTDTMGLKATSSFLLTVDKAPAFGAITDPTVVQHGNGAQVPTTVALNTADPDSGAITYTVALADPLFDLRTQLGLTNPAFGFDTRGQKEWYFTSTNGSNAANGGLYMLLPGGTSGYGMLYAWAGTFASTKAGTPVADFNAPAYARDVYAEPNLIPNAAAPTGAGASASGGEALTTDPATLALAALRTKYGLVASALPFNYRRASEYYFQSTNGSNAANGGYYFLLPNNALYAWQGSVGGSALVADFANDPTYGGKDVYGSAGVLLTTASEFAGVPGLTASVDPSGTGTLTLTPALGFEGSVKVTVTANDGTFSTPMSFTYTVTDARPTLSPIADVSVAHDVGSASVALNYGDTQNDASAAIYRVDVSGYDPLHDVKATYGLTQPAFGFNTNGGNEWYFTSTNRSNTANGTLFVLVSSGAADRGKLYAWAGSLAASTTPANLVADFNDPKYAGANVYKAPNMIPNSVTPSTLVALNRSPLYDVQQRFGLTGTASGFNTRGHQEWYFTSANGSNGNNGGLYVLVPSGPNSGGLLYAWQGTYASTTAQPPVADLTAYPGWSRPSILSRARPALLGDPLFDLKQVYGLTNAPGGFNNNGGNEYYFRSLNGSNAANGGLYVLVPGGTSGYGMLYAWAGSLAASTTPANLVADFNDPKYGVNVYANPLLVTEASGLALGVTATVSGNTLTLTGNPAFAGTVRVTVTASDGAESTSRSFLFTVTDQGPTLQPIANQAGTSSSGGMTIPLTAGDADGEALTYAVTITSNPLFDVRTKYGLTQAAFGFNNNGAGEWYFQSTNGANAANGGLFVLGSDNKLYAWAGNLTATLAMPPVVDFNAGVYDGTHPGVYNAFDLYGAINADQSFLANQSQPPVGQVTGSVSGSTLTLSWPTSFTGVFGVTVTAGDGVNEVERSFLVTVS
jgi:hypothetical protein